MYIGYASLRNKLPTKFSSLQQPMFIISQFGQVRNPGEV